MGLKKKETEKKQQRHNPLTTSLFEDLRSILAAYDSHNLLRASA